MADSSLETEKKTCLINKSTRQAEFLVIANNGYIRDIRLSLKAKGVLTLMLTNKSDWVIHICEIVRHSRDGLSAISSAFKELSECKYLKKVTERDEKGHFLRTTYYIYDEPYDGSPIQLCSLSNSITEEVQKVENPNTEKPLVENPLVENPLVENPLVENPNSEKPQTGKPQTGKRKLTNNNSINKKKTEQTNPTKQTVETQKLESESSFNSIITKLFEGRKVNFDSHFESDVISLLEDSKIDLEHLEKYLGYVYERTRMSNVTKSFGAYFRKLALAESIVSDFYNGYLFKNNNTQKQAAITYIQCPICNSEIESYANACPTCGTEIRIIKNTSLPEFIVRRALWKMSDDERQAYEEALAKFEIETKRECHRPFITSEQYLEFWRDYGLLNQEVTNE